MHSRLGCHSSIHLVWFRVVAALACAAAILAGDFTTQAEDLVEQFDGHDEIDPGIPVFPHIRDGGWMAWRWLGVPYYPLIVNYYSPANALLPHDAFVLATSRRREETPQWSTLLDVRRHPNAAADVLGSPAIASSPILSAHSVDETELQRLFRWGFLNSSAFPRTFFGLRWWFGDPGYEKALGIQWELLQGRFNQRLAGASGLRRFRLATVPIFSDSEYEYSRSLDFASKQRYINASDVARWAAGEGLDEDLVSISNEGDFDAEETFEEYFESLPHWIADLYGRTMTPSDVAEDDYWMRYEIPRRTGPAYFWSRAWGNLRSATGDVAKPRGADILGTDVYGFNRPEQMNEPIRYFDRYLFRRIYEGFFGMSPEIAYRSRALGIEPASLEEILTESALLKPDVFWAYALSTSVSPPRDRNYFPEQPSAAIAFSAAMIRNAGHLEYGLIAFPISQRPADEPTWPETILQESVPTVPLQNTR